jgi:hypothetical protein
MGMHDFATCLPVPPPSPTRDGSGHPISSSEGFQHLIGSTGAETTGNSNIYYMARQDVAIGAHTCLIAGI